jgi:hypothetical protein
VNFKRVLGRSKKPDRKRATKTTDLTAHKTAGLSVPDPGFVGGRICRCAQHYHFAAVFVAPTLRSPRPLSLLPWCSHVQLPRAKHHNWNPWLQNAPCCQEATMIMDSLKWRVKGHLSKESLARLRRLRAGAKTIGKSSDLSALATVYGTDKWGGHFYTQHYQRYFSAWRKRNIRLLEIGVGGESDLDAGGQSLRMWRRYFPNAQIVGIDLYDKTHLSEKRMTVLQCDQTDTARLASISEKYGPFDIVIDDGSHLNEHVMTTFQFLFPLLKSPGFYAIEDLQTAYWPSWGGIRGKSSVDYLKRLVDGLNYAENPMQQQPTYFDRNIIEIAFFHNLCVITKGNNDEPTNCIELITKERETSEEHIL